ncbi:hypothetical protein HPB50_015635 [Hyalomma asiaticum]|uniref:Uncharacterized protein n=1 Tax=Hyalomma asiaticum TaxID=266040 RepID=A0ACB7TI49_HYAAI|nr:hypothetical protein HPB50_015635 [Hyalomma asiaticum]
MSVPGLQSPPPFLPSPGRPAIPWDQWKQAFETYMVASGATELLAGHRKAIQLTYWRGGGHRIFSAPKSAALPSGSTTVAIPRTTSGSDTQQRKVTTTLRSACCLHI